MCAAHTVDYYFSPSLLLSVTVYYPYLNPFSSILQYDSSPDPLVAFVGASGRHRASVCRGRSANVRCNNIGLACLPSLMICIKIVSHALRISHLIILDVGAWFIILSGHQLLTWRFSVFVYKERSYLRAPRLGASLQCNVAVYTAVKTQSKLYKVWFLFQLPSE